MGGNHYHCALNISDNNQEQSTDFNTFDCWLTNLFFAGREEIRLIPLWRSGAKGTSLC